MFNTNGKPTSPRTIVRDGLTHRERLLVAERDPRTMAAFDSFDADTRNAICNLCDEYRQKMQRKGKA